VVSKGQSPALVECFEERTFRYTGGKYKDAEIKYRLHSPQTIRYGRTFPLVIHLHGRGEAGSDNTRSLRHLDSILPVLTGPKRQDFFLLVLHCPSETPYWDFRSTKDGTLDVLVAAMEHVIAENPVDKKRITVTGVSSGGWGVWELIMRHPDMFAGAVPTACSAPQQLQRLAALKQTPVWVIVNKGDRLVNIEPLPMAKQVINRSGGSMTFTEANAPLLGHNAFVPAMKDYNCIRWMLAQKRGSWLSPLPGVIVQKPNSLLLAFLMYFLPFAIIVFLLWENICELVSTLYQSVRKQIGKI